MYLSEPVEATEDWLPSLFALWQVLQGVELLRAETTRYRNNPAVLEKLAPTFQDIARRATRRATAICQFVDSLIEKMKPLEGS